MHVRPRSRFVQHRNASWIDHGGKGETVRSLRINHADFITVFNLILQNNKILFDWCTFVPRGKQVIVSTNSGIRLQAVV